MNFNYHSFLTVILLFCLQVLPTSISAQGPVVTYPAGGEEFKVGDTIQITWSNHTVGDVVGIDYTVDNWTNTTWLDTYYSNSSENSYTWVIPDDRGTQGKVGIFNLSFQGNVSSGFFTIYQPETEVEFESDLTAISAGECIQMENNTTGGNNMTYQWTFDGGNPGTSTEKNPIVCYETAGNYDITLEATSYDKTDVLTKSSYVEVDFPASIEIVSSSQIELFPNPASDFIFIPEQFDNSDISIFNLQGQVVYRSALSDGALDISTLAPGTYLLHLSKGQETSTSLFQKQ